MYTHDLFYLQQEWEAWLVPIYKQIRTSKSQHNVQNINVNKTYIRIKSMLPWLKWYITITIQRFASASGLQLNYDKSTAVWIGPLRNSRTKFMPELNFTCNPATFKVLDVIFSTNIQETVLLNSENKLVEIRKLLNACSPHSAKS